MRGGLKRKERKRSMPRIRKGDTVIVISGKEKGNTGKVLSVDWKKERFMVEGLNMVIRHTKPNQRNQKGGLMRMEAPIHCSNVQLYSSDLKRGVRFRQEINEAGVKNRICVKTGEVLG